MTQPDETTITADVTINECHMHTATGTPRVEVNFYDLDKLQSREALDDLFSQLYDAQDAFYGRHVAACKRHTAGKKG